MRQNWSFLASVTSIWFFWSLWKGINNFVHVCANTCLGLPASIQDSPKSWMVSSTLDFLTRGKRQQNFRFHVWVNFKTPCCFLRKYRLRQEEGKVFCERDYWLRLRWFVCFFLSSFLTTPASWEIIYYIIFSVISQTFKPVDALPHIPLQLQS